MKDWSIKELSNLLINLITVPCTERKTCLMLSENLYPKAVCIEFRQTLTSQHIKKKNSEINAFITVDEGRSLDQAKLADQIIQKGEGDVLTGVPIAQKDIFCAEDWLTTCGSKMLHNFVAPYDATVVKKFNEVGAVNLGKTNMDEFISNKYKSKL